MSKHVVVVGAGIVGLCAAHELLEKGHRVTLVEKEVHAEKGCSFGNGGIIVPSHFVPLAAPGMIGMGLRMMPDKRSPFGLHGLASVEVASWVIRFMQASNKAHVERCAPILRDMNLASRRIYEALAANAPEEVGYAHRGLLMLCRTQKALEGEKHLADDANKLGLRAHPMTREEVSKLEPGLQMDVEGGVFFEDDAHLTPAAFMKFLREKVASQGAEIKLGSEVSSFDVQNDRVSAAMIRGERVTADEFVLAAGVWTGKVAQPLNLRLPLLSGKGYGFTVPNPPQPMRIPSIFVEGRIAVTPMSDGVRFVGTMELGQPREGSNPNRVEGMKQTIPLYYPAYRSVGLENLPVWSGHRPCTPDGMPYLGRPNRYRNVVVAAGHAMMGMSLGPISGRLVAQLVTGEKPTIPLELLSPDRYG